MNGSTPSRRDVAYGRLGLSLSVLFVACILVGAPWWAFWIPLFLIFLLALLAVPLALLEKKPTNVVPFEKRGPRK